jgi:hypothetical protein
MTIHLFKINYKGDKNVTVNFNDLAKNFPEAFKYSVNIVDQGANQGKTLAFGQQHPETPKNLLVTERPLIFKSDDIVYVVSHGNAMGRLVGTAGAEITPEALANTLKGKQINVDLQNQLRSENPRIIDLVACHSYRCARALAPLMPGAKVYGYPSPVNIVNGRVCCVTSDGAGGKDVIQNPGDGRLIFTFKEGQLNVQGKEDVPLNMRSALLPADRPTGTFYG